MAAAPEVPGYAVVAAPALTRSWPAPNRSLCTRSSRRSPARDAIGNHSLIAQRLLRVDGPRARRSTPHRRPGGSGTRCATSRRCDATHGAWVIYQCSTGAPIADVLAEREAPLIVDYHNITPPRLFEAWEPRDRPRARRGATAARAARRAGRARTRRLGVQPRRARSLGLSRDRGRSGPRRPRDIRSQGRPPSLRRADRGQAWGRVALRRTARAEQGPARRGAGVRARTGGATTRRDAVARGGLVVRSL